MRSLLNKILSHPHSAPRFFNTLSLLEYIGARKILKSQNQENLSLELLTHMNEEIRHSMILKKMALKLSDGLCKTFEEHDLLCGKEAVHYFQTVDHAAEKQFGEKNFWKNYLITTFLIEERANQLYPLLDEVLGELGLPKVMAGILKEEEKHLGLIQKWAGEVPGLLSKIKELTPLENEAFGHFMDEVSIDMHVHAY